VTARRRRQTAAALLVAGMHAALLWLLLQPVPRSLSPSESAMILVEVAMPPPPALPPTEAPTPKAGPDRDAAAASPPVPRARPQPVVALRPDVPVPSPAVAATAAADGPDLQAGAGGVGVGSGTGGAGAGSRGGIVRARWASGSINRKDYPETAAKARIGGSVTVYFDVTVEGRARNCRVIRTSGNPALDSTTCRLIELRFRYTPARNAAGEPVEDVAGWRQDWWLEPPLAK
jgi:protein TonB